jgi:hypothetical protein
LSLLSVSSLFSPLFSPLLSCRATFQTWKKRWFVFEGSTRKMGYHSQQEELGMHEKGALEVVKWFDIPDRGGDFREHRFDVLGAAPSALSTGRLYSIAAPSKQMKMVWLNKLKIAVGPGEKMEDHPRHSEFLSSIGM